MYFIATKHERYFTLSTDPNRLDLQLNGVHQINSQGEISSVCLKSYLDCLLVMSRSRSQNIRSLRAKLLPVTVRNL